jgi:hypothetical protein
MRIFFFQLPINKYSQPYIQQLWLFLIISGLPYDCQFLGYGEMRNARKILLLKPEGK